MSAPLHGASFGGLGIAAGLALGLALGCTFSDKLRDAPCNSDDDCLGEYRCVRTVQQMMTGDAGLCRSDGRCAVGAQEGCLAREGSLDCEGALSKVCSDDGTACYCCDVGSDALVALGNVGEDGSSAQCIVCAPDLCDDETEPCIEGDARCDADEDGCGCRIPDDLVEDSPCDDDESCGEGFVCTRTLEQATEPQEPLAEDKPAADGWCRPEGAPGCAAGQPGCRASDGCPTDQTQRCDANGRCFCCPRPEDSERFDARIYAVDDDGSSAACISCPREPCTTSACTPVETASCEVVHGVCGCDPMIG